MTEITVPDIGDFTDVPIVEILVEVGQEVAKDEPLIVLESDKASMEVPSTAAGKIEELLVEVGDKVSQGTAVARIAEAGGSEDESSGDEQPEDDQPENEQPEDHEPSGDRVEVLVLGSGPGGYTAAFRAADLGLDVTLVERYESLGGVCLNVGCIPSKALLHVAKVIADAGEQPGVSFGEPEIDVEGVRAFKQEAVDKLTGGLDGLAKRRKVDVVRGVGRFTGAHTLEVEGGDSIDFEHAIVCTGSRAVELPGIPHDDERVMDSTGALELQDVPDRLLVIGGGIIGLEMATVYDALGSEVTVVEMADQIIPGCDADLVKPLFKRIEGRYAEIKLGTKVEEIEAADDGLTAKFADGSEGTFDRVLVAVGRIPNGADLGLDAAGVEVTDRGFVEVDEQQRTNVSHIFAIGDVVGPPMLAHKAMHEGKVAAEVIAGQDVAFDVRGIPNVAYTDPEVAWVGLTETEAKETGTDYEKASFPWAASGRALSVGSPAGLTKLLVDPESRRVLGAGIVGAGAGELIAEAGLALEMGADADDVGLTIHPHPTLSETVGLAAQVADGTVTDIPNPAAGRPAKDGS